VSTVRFGLNIRSKCTAKWIRIRFTLPPPPLDLGAGKSFSIFQEIPCFITPPEPLLLRQLQLYIIEWKEAALTARVNREEAMGMERISSGSLSIRHLKVKIR